MNKKMGEKIKKLRTELGMTQSELAEPEMTKGMLSHIEKGYANPSMKNLQYIAQKLNRPIAYFLQDEQISEKIYKREINLPLDEILIELKNIDICIKDKKYLIAKEKLITILNSYEFEENDKVFADISYRLGYCYILLKEFDEGEEHIKKCCNAYVKNQLYVDAARSNIKLLNKYLFTFQFNKCSEIIDRSYDLYKKSSNRDAFFEIEMLINQPGIYYVQGDFIKAINICEKVISLSEETNVFYLIDDAYRIMAIIYLFEGDYEKFLINADKARKYVEVTNNKFGLIKTLHNYAKYENIIGNPSKALEHLKLLESNIKEKNFYYYLEHGKAQYLLGNYNDAIEDFNNIDYRVNINYLFDYVYILTSKVYKGLTYSKLGNCEKAIADINNAIKEIGEYTKSEYLGVARYAYKELGLAYESISEVYSLMGNFKAAYVSLKKANESKELSKYK